MQLFPGYLSAEKAYALLEAVLFLPLFALFLTVAADTGFYLTDRSSVLNALRAGLNSSSAPHGSVLRLSDNGSTLPDDDSIHAVLERVTSEIATTLSDSRSSAPASSYNVFVKAILLGPDGARELGSKSEGGLPRVADEAPFVAAELEEFSFGSDSSTTEIVLFVEVSARARGLHRELNLFGSPLVIKKRTIFLLRTQLG